MSLDDLKISVSSPKELDSFKYLDVLERRLNCDVDERDAVLLRHFFLSIYSILAGRQVRNDQTVLSAQSEQPNHRELEAHSAGIEKGVDIYLHSVLVPLLTIPNDPPQRNRHI
ncbi:hypothetical protein HUJ05_011635 [Dendroctonus ponderosae]|nr:hypothetical protein HUJ05_011635 [Dendroctonus ponderosae]